MIVTSDFKPAWWLTNEHAQTIYPTLMRHRSALIDKHERLELPDGDFIDLAWAVNGLGGDAPLVVFLHGLGGGSHSAYAPGLLSAFNRAGFRAVLMHFRGASHEPNRLSRAYHSGDTGDLSFLLKTLHEREPHTKKVAVGVSLGGNVLLKWLGESGSNSLLQAAVAVSVPFQLQSVADKVNQGFSRLYQAHLLRSLRRTFVRKFSDENVMFPFSAEELNKLSCFWTFDDRVTAPLHGFPNVHAYYREVSSKQFLRNITTPTLVIHSLDDPFMTQEIIPKEGDLSSDVTLELSDHGGHVGFISGKIPGRPIYWLEHRIPLFLKERLTF